MLRPLEPDDRETVLACLPFDLLRELLVAGEVGDRAIGGGSKLLADEQGDERFSCASGQLNRRVTGHSLAGGLHLVLPRPQLPDRRGPMACEELDIALSSGHANSVVAL